MNAPPAAVPRLRAWLDGGMPGVWLTAGAVSCCLIMVAGLMLIIAANGLTHFWPAAVERLSLVGAPAAERYALGEVADIERVPVERLTTSGVAVPDARATVERVLLKVGNRDTSGLDFRWFNDFEIASRDRPHDAVVIERREWGNFYGYVRGLREGERVHAADAELWSAIERRYAHTQTLLEDIRRIEKGEMGAINHTLDALRLRERRHELAGSLDASARAHLSAERDALDEKYRALGDTLAVLQAEVARDSLLLASVNGAEAEVGLRDVVRLYRPNRMSVVDKVAHYLAKLAEFVAAEPREANTEGGVFPAIFGTVMMVLLMAVLVTPFGVVAAIYLHEYARQGLITRIIRIAVNNLAGVPSVVYGVFGLGFFVYAVGGSIDQLFYQEALPAPTFGTPGLLWSSLTLALLTVPVVIVSTEEGLARIPRSIREGSLALGATKAETLWRTVLPMATPAMMTGLILAVARAAGEVAPLMMVGVVKLAPSLPLDGNWPFLHLERKFMHLGFHIYDVGFQSPNVEAARPLVFATALLLVAIIVALNLAAITIRNRLREKYNATET